MTRSSFPQEHLRPLGTQRVGPEPRRARPLAATRQPPPADSIWAQAPARRARRGYVPRVGDPHLLRAREGRPTGRVLARVIEVQAELLDELSDIDRDVQELVDRRAVVGELLGLCRDALGGVGSPYLRRVPLPGELDARPAGTRVVTGPELRSALRTVLRATGRALTIDELHRSLLARGVRAPDPVSRSISNALGIESGRGTVRRVRRGIYSLADPTADPTADRRRA